MIDRYKVEEIEAAADVVVWCCDEAPGFAPTGRRTSAVVANIVEAMRRYASGELGEQPIPFDDADRIDRHRLRRHDERRAPGAPSAC